MFCFSYTYADIYIKSGGQGGDSCIKHPSRTATKTTIYPPSQETEEQVFTLRVVFCYCFNLHVLNLNWDDADSAVMIIYY